MKRSQILSAVDILKQTQGRVLLINPPVIDSRYEWIKWNQPLDLLKFGTLLKTSNECQVKLFDFMFPNPSGVVPRRQSRIEFDLSPEEPTRWHFGKSWETFDAFLDLLLEKNWIPDSVWITTLTSFWWQTVPLVADRVKNKLKRPAIVLFGNYPALQTQHAAQFCFNVDVIVEDRINFQPFSADYSLYEDRKPKFCALDLYSQDPLSEISQALRNGINHFIFFNENIFIDFDSFLKPLLDEVVKMNWNLQFHGICGIETRDFPLDHAALLANAHFSEFHFEPVLTPDGIVDVRLYSDVMNVCEQTGFVQRRGEGWESRRYYISGFLWIGHPDDDIDKLVWNSLKLLQLVGMVIPKPYSPTPGTKEYSLLESNLNYIEPEDISPHRFAFAEINHISKEDYLDLYRMTAFLNKKVRGQTFDFLGNTYLADVIKQSLIDKRWDINLGEKLE